jgi:hypothetical protein
MSSAAEIHARVIGVIARVAASVVVAGRRRYRLWTIRQKGRTLSAEVVCMHRQWHLRLFAQGILFLSHPCEQLDIALEYADLIRDDFAGERWR